MAADDIMQGLIDQLGQSQDERTPAQLAAHFADVDERGPDALLQWLRRFAALVQFHPATPGAAATDWSAFFPAIAPGQLSAYLAANSGRVTPHLGLLLAFLELYARPQAIANQITGRHLDFYLRDVLRLRPRDAVADHAHVLVELKKGAESTAITTDTDFSAGKDATGVELLYAPVRETVVGHAAVKYLRSIYVDSDGTVRFAPQANSSDGLGGALPADEPAWPPFGSGKLSAAEVGFALASPVLRLAEGQRTVTLRLELAAGLSPAPSQAQLKEALRLFLTGKKAWIEPSSFTPTLSGTTLLLEATLQADEAAVVDYDATVHGYSYATDAPVAQVLLRQDDDLRYGQLRSLVLESAQVSVVVSGVSAGLELESDAGTLNPKKAFLPFGPQPTAGSRFLVGYEEALAKRLSEVTLKLRWKDVPAASLGSWYDDYTTKVTNASFKVSASFQDASGTPYTASGKPLFDANDATTDSTIQLKRSASTQKVVQSEREVRALKKAGSVWAARVLQREVAARPVLKSHAQATEPPVEGYVTLTLEQGFLAAEYRQLYVQTALQYAKSGTGTPDLPNPPYTPTLQSITLGYAASSEAVDISSTSASEFAKDVQFFQVAPFGALREHAYQLSQLGFPARVSLLPEFPDTGALLIGLSDLEAGDGVSLLFQVAPGSADPDLPHQRLTWSVLCDNHWKALDSSQLVLDTTNDLLASGIVKLVIPDAATTVNTVLPTGYLWLKAGMPGDPAAACQLVDVQANAVELRFEDQGNDPAHLAQALAAKKITKVKDGLATVKSVAQPYASFGGTPAEGDASFRTRTAERLRHKDRCITPWDYERVVLEAFPEVHRVKCIPHACDCSWNAPGHVLLVVVPDLRNRNAVDPLRPRVDADSLSRIVDHVQARAGMGVKVAVKNPRFQKVRLDFAVKLRTGYDFNHYGNVLQQALIQTLSPWAFAGAAEPRFGGTIYRSVLLDFVEQQPYVDYVTDFHMYSFSGTVPETTDLEVARPATPDTLLVSDGTHVISEAS